MSKRFFAAIAHSSLLASASLLSAAPLRVMILDGQSAGTYHDWRHTTPVLKKELENAGLFQVDVVTAPPSGGDFKSFIALDLKAAVSCSHRSSMMSLISEMISGYCLDRFPKIVNENAFIAMGISFD